MWIIARIVASAAYFVTLIYSTVFLKKNKRPSYFKCAFYGLLPLCLSAFYNLALETDISLKDGFSLGILGEAAAYIFVTTANSALIVKEESERKAYLSVAGLICAVIGLVISAAPLIFERSIITVVSFVLYVVSICPCLYYCTEVCVNRFDNPFKQAVKHFNILIIAHCFATALFPLAKIFAGPVAAVISVFCIIGWIVPGIFAMLVLKKGLEPWEI